MKITRAERAAVGITLAALLCFSGFYLWGRLGRSGVTVETEKNAPVQTVEPEAASAAPVLPERAVEPSAPAPQASPEAERDERLDLNTATQEELEALPGIGPVRAGQILEYRRDHGGFESVAELLNVEGIGEKTFEKVADYLKVG